MPKKNVEQSFSVSFNFGYRKILCIRGVGHDFFSNIFCSTRPKKNVEESFSDSFNFGNRKSLCIGGVCLDILSKIFVALCRKEM